MALTACGGQATAARTSGVIPAERDAPTAREAVKAPATKTAQPDEDVAEPVRVRVPAIGVDAAVIPLDLEADGSLEVPTDFAQTGWWTGGPEPGERGPAVIAGHVDSTDGPAVFYSLRDLAPGGTISVKRADGSTVNFVVERIEQHPKDAFPTRAVYGDTKRPTLRLITCGGDFNRDSGHYPDNVIVYASAA